MTKNQPATTPTFDPLKGLTGRDGAVDFAAETEVLGAADFPESASSPQDPNNRFALALGKAVIAGWAQLAREDQERLFELAVSAGGKCYVRTSPSSCTTSMSEPRRRVDRLNVSG